MHKSSFFLLAALLVFGVAAAQAQNTIQATTARPFAGSYSLQVTYDGSSTAAYVVDAAHAQDETVHHVVIKAYLDVAGGYTMAPNDRHQIIKAREGGAATAWRAVVRRIKGATDPVSLYRMVMWCNHNGMAPPQDEFIGEVYFIPDKWQQFHFEWKAESSPGAGDGACSIYKNDPNAAVTKFNISAPFVVQHQYLGAFDFSRNLGTGGGSIFYDNFESYRSVDTPGM